MNRQIDIMATRFESLEMASNLLAANVIEIHVRDENCRALELEAVGHTLLPEQATVTIPANKPLGAGIECSLQNVQCNLIEQDAIAIIERQNATGFAVFKQLGVETEGTHATLDNLILDLGLRNNIEHARTLEHLFDTEALADARRTRHNHRSNRTVHCTLGHNVQNFETLTNSLDDLFIGFLALRLRLRHLSSRDHSSVH